MDIEFSAPVVIRPASVQDAQSIADVHIASWKSTYPGIVPQTYIDGLNSDEFTQRWRTRLAQESEMLIHVAEQAGAICGFASAGRGRQSIAGFAGELYAIYLLSSAQRKGIGSKMFLSMATALTARGFDSMFVWVLQRNPSCRFYEQMGGTPIEEAKLEIGGEMMTETAYGWPDLKTFAHKPSTRP